MCEDTGKFTTTRQCVTHHHACDCREKHFADMERRFEVAKNALRWIATSPQVFKEPVWAHRVAKDALNDISNATWTD
jgi:hypothetical protein